MSDSVTRWAPDLLKDVVRDARDARALPPSPFGLFDGKQDYRGLPLAGPISAQHLGESRIPGTAVSWRASKVDLSDADLNNVAFERCEFEDVLFRRTILGAASDHGCTFTRCVFDHTEMRKAVVGYEGSRYQQCTFTRVRLAGAGVIRPEFDECTFDHCYMKDLQFEAASFEACAFIGPVVGVVFRNGYTFAGDYRRFGTPRPNRMHNVDFSRAELSFVGFDGGVDLSTVRLPMDGSCVRFDRWQQRLACLRHAAQSATSGDNEGRKLFLRVYDPQRPLRPWYKRLLPTPAATKEPEQHWHILNEAETRAEFGDEVWQSLLEC